MLQLHWKSALVVNQLLFVTGNINCSFGHNTKQTVKRFQNNLLTKRANKISQCYTYELKSKLYLYWICVLLQDDIIIHFYQFDLKNNILYQDNQSEIKMDKNGHNSCTGNFQYINIRYFWVKYSLDKREISVEYCPTYFMLAN